MFKRKSVELIVKRLAAITEELAQHANQQWILSSDLAAEASIAKLEAEHADRIKAKLVELLK